MFMTWAGSGFGSILYSVDPESIRIQVTFKNKSKYLYVSGTFYNAGSLKIRPICDMVENCIKLENGYY